MKNVYYFGDGKAEGTADQKTHLEVKALTLQK